MKPSLKKLLENDEMNDPSDYTITVRRFYEDGAYAFKATVRELPHVQGLGSTYAEAYEMALEAIEGLQEMAAEDGAPFPEPAQESSTEWSGRVTLRLPKSLHRKATEVAEDEGVSFNQFLVTVITDAVSRKSAVTLMGHPEKEAHLTDMYRGLVYGGAQKRLVAKSTNPLELFMLSPENTQEVLLQTSLQDDPFIVYGLTGNG